MADCAVSTSVQQPVQEPVQEPVQQAQPGHDEETFISERGCSFEVGACS